jgi:hypothetical protein
MTIASAESLLARMNWYKKMVEAYKSLSEEQLIALEKWEKEKKPGQDITNWPGWEVLIGSRPDFPESLG